MSISCYANVSYNVDYRSKVDDAWYTAAVFLEDGKRLRVKFKDFVESHYDEVYSIADFSTNKSELEEFLRRFRRETEVIEDNECSRVITDMVVCGTYKGDGSVRFFDAIVDAVHYKEHTPEKCICTYILVWQHGPEVGNMTTTSIDDICLILPRVVDPKVTEFAKIVNEKLGSDKTLDKLQDFDTAGYSYVKFYEGRGRFYPQVGDLDRDLGGVKETGCHHYVILENLEKDLSPSSMMEFLHVQTSITLQQAYLSSSLSAETYARGVIVVDSRAKFQRIYDFLSNPNHFIDPLLEGHG